MSHAGELVTRGFKGVAQQMISALFAKQSFTNMMSMMSDHDETPLRTMSNLSFVSDVLGVKPATSHIIYDVLISHSVLMSKRSFSMGALVKGGAVSYIAPHIFVQDPSFALPDSVSKRLTSIASHCGIQPSVLTAHVIHTLKRCVGFRFMLADVVSTYLKDDNVSVFVTRKWQDLTRMYTPQIKAYGKRIGHFKALNLVRDKILFELGHVHGGAEFKLLMDYYSRPVSSFTHLQLSRVADLIGLPELPSASQVHYVLRRDLFKRARLIGGRRPELSRGVMQYLTMITILKNK